ncbi:MAG: anti-sigma factor [Hyphomicrobium sp.]
MIDGDDIDGLAAEYVLGTLAADERVMVAARAQREPALAAAIAAWERRLTPLAGLVPEVAPPPGIFAGIERRIAATARAHVGAADLATLRRRVQRWRAGALTATALAASLAGFIALQAFAPKPPGQTFVAVLQKDAASPAFLVSVDVDKRLMTVRPVAAEHTPDKSYELWLVHDSLGAPKSLGVIDEKQPMERPTLAAYNRDVITASTFAVSLEPAGGSPTGAPTGPVVFAGKLIPTSR